MHNFELLYHEGPQLFWLGPYRQMPYCQHSFETLAGAPAESGPKLKLIAVDMIGGLATVTSMVPFANPPSHPHLESHYTIRGTPDR